ncbi:MAG: hypothetical protein U1E49_16120 [Hyphomicrobiaceae bacterium]
MSRIALALLAFSVSITPAKAETEVPAAEAIGLQAAMQRHIEANLVDGALLHIDPVTGIVQSFYPAKAHPKIMQVGPYYYLCANFRDDAGTEVMVNFYVAKQSGKYVFFHTLFGEDEAFEAQFEKHAAQPAN